MSDFGDIPKMRRFRGFSMGQKVVAVTKTLF